MLDKQRSKAIISAEKKEYNLAILDDGFQDYSIKKNLNILCFNSNQFIGNGMTLPSGPLRESLSAFKRTQIVLINGNKNVPFEDKILSTSNKVKIFYSKYLPENIEEFRKKNLFAFAGIGNPSNFFKLLSDNNLNVHTKLSFPDHYKFSKSEIQKMVDEAETFKEEDEKIKIQIEARNELDSLIYRTKQSLEEEPLKSSINEDKKQN